MGAGGSGTSMRGMGGFALGISLMT